MTTPLDVLDFPQPFGVPLTTTANSATLQIATKHQNYPGGAAASRLAIPEGVSIVQATYSGPEGANLYYSPGTGSRIIARISEKTGGGERSTAPVIVSATEPGAFLFLVTWTVATQPQQGSITVMPYALP